GEIERELRHIAAIDAKGGVRAVERAIEGFVAVESDEIGPIGSIVQRPIDRLLENRTSPKRGSHREQKTGDDRNCPHRLKISLPGESIKFFPLTYSCMGI